MLIGIGLSHHQVGSTDLNTLSTVLPRVSELPADGFVALVTCNRFELYLDAPEFHPCVDGLRHLIIDAIPQHPALADQLVVYVGDGAIEHLFMVAAGLDSMVVGDDQISAQVIDALASSHSRPTPRLHRMFRAAATAAKAVASSVQLGLNGRSLASVGLDLVAARHGELAGKTVLLAGTGSYARVAYAELIKRGVTGIYVWSASDRAASFVASHPAVAIPRDGLAAAAADVDFAVGCSASGTMPFTLPVLAAEREHLIPILDLALGGSVTDDASALPHVDVIDLDEIGAHTPDEDATRLLQATGIIKQAVATYRHMETGRGADPMITAMRSHISQIIAAETEQARRRYDQTTADAVARSLHRVSNALLHTPSVRAAELARTGELDDYARALRTLFGIEVEA